MNSARKSGLLCTSILASALLLPGGQASAQTVFTTIQAFGDSYADTGNLIKIIGPQALYPTGRFSGGTNFVDTTSSLLGIPQNNFAIGGATSGPTNVVAPGIPGFTQEWQGFIASGKTIAPTDLVEFSIGGNDARAYYRGGGTLAGATAAATTSFNQTMAGINALVGVGARTIVFTTGDVSTWPEATGNPAAPIGSAFSQNYNAQIQTALAAIARSGVRVELVDIAALGNLIKADPSRYGLTSAGTCPVACIGNPALQNQFLFYVDALHLSSHGFAILGEYIVNRLNAPLTIGPQADVGLSSAIGFASTLFGRLDTFRETTGFASVMNSNAADLKVPYTKAPPPRLTYNPWSFYMLANGAVSDRQATVAARGFDLDSVGGTIGTEYRINANAFVGGAFDYSNPKARLFNNAGSTEANAYQVGAYGAWTNANFFLQGLATVGWQNYRNVRPGVVDLITSNPDGTSVVAAGKIGYLFGTPDKVQVGPIGSLLYARARVNGFTEAGDPVLTLNIGSQTAETLIGSVGAQFRFPFWVGGKLISPYVNLTADDDIIGNGRIVQFGATSPPIIINNLAIPNANSHNVYGRIASGFVTPGCDNVAWYAHLSQPCVLTECCVV